MGGCLSFGPATEDRLYKPVPPLLRPGNVAKASIEVSGDHIYHTAMALSPPHPRATGSTRLRVFTLSELQGGTESFTHFALLGEGGFGRVFRGYVNNLCIDNQEGGGKQLVAVKVLDTEGLQGHKEWMAEVDLLGSLLHPRLVRLLGYCAEEEQRLLVYEFMAEGSLEHHLFPGVSVPLQSAVLPWSTRMKIALEAAEGLYFLHEGTARPVIYRDFKASNILLNKDFEAKLSDFGLARDGPKGDRTHVSTRVMGTYGYAAPEYVLTGHLSNKSDIYSFGVVLLELITGRRAMDRSRATTEHSLVEWVRKQFTDKQKLFRLLDPKLEGNYSIKGALHAVLLANQCLAKDAKTRPAMSEVVATLVKVQGFTDQADDLYNQLSKRNSSVGKPKSPLSSGKATQAFSR